MNNLKQWGLATLLYAADHEDFLPANGPPTISSIGPQHTLMNAPTGPIPFIIGDPDSPAATLNLTGFSSNTNLVPEGNFAFSGSDSNRTVTLTPAVEQSGVAVVTLMVSDGTNRANSSFPLMVVPAAGVIFYDPFSYADGPLTTNSGFLWNTHSGTVGQMEVASGQLLVNGARNEDVNGRLLGSPYSTNSGSVLYARLTVNFSALPSNNGDFFAHFKDAGNNFRGRIFASATNAAAGLFRFGIANGTNTVSAQTTRDSSLGATDTVVVRYDVGVARTTLWLNPAAESDPSVTAADAASAISISSFAFRQDSGMGSLAVDDLRIATSFADVLAANPTVRAQIEHVDNGVAVFWPASMTGFVLQGTATLPSMNWTNVPFSTSGNRNEAILPNLGEKGFFRLIIP